MIMKAVRIHSYGGPEVLEYEDAPRPKAGPGEVLVRIQAAGVNPIDWKVREGYLKSVRNYSFPLILGWDLSGIVEDTGPGPNRFKKGDEVFSRPDASKNGAYAEYIAVKEAELAPKPKSIDHIHAAAIPLAGLTAWQALFDTAGLAAGQMILIHGAAGGVGGYAVQLAKSKGARVIGTASRRNQDYLRELGADETIDYQTTRFENVVHDADVVLDTIGGETQGRSWSALKAGGILVSTVDAPSAEDASAHGVRAARVGVQSNAIELEEIARLVDEGKFRAAVEVILPLSEARRAHELSQSGHQRGKIVLKVG